MLPRLMAGLAILKHTHDLRGALAGDSLIHECTSSTALTCLHNLIVQASERARMRRH